MVKTTDLVAALRCCASDEIDECRRCPMRTAWDCVSCMKRASADKIEELVDRCARYAEEIAVLRGRQRWIPVTERLPEDRSNVLVVAYWHERWGVYMGWCAPERVEWCVHIGIGDRDDVAVTHWMPLPAAPEVE